MHSLKVMSSPTRLDFYNDGPHIITKSLKLFHQNCLTQKYGSLAIFAELLSQALVPQLNDHWFCEIWCGRPVPSLQS